MKMKMRWEDLGAGKMWSVENEKVKLDILKVNSDFKIISEGGLHLICPKYNIDWKEEEKFLRSIVIDDNGFVVSSGWKKFGNYGEFSQDKVIVDEALKENKIKFSHKHDGSLAIRYVYNGEVFFRTRGTLFGGTDTEDNVAYGERFKTTALKYPILLDNTFMTDRSLLFEYVSPSNLIVIRYEEEDLIFLGFVSHDNLQNGRWEEVEKIAIENKFNLVRLHELPKNPIKLLEEIKTWKDEGVVIRCNDDQTFVKMKSDYYLENHRFKFSMTYIMIVDFVLLNDVKSEEELIDNLKLLYDWEIIEIAKGFYQRYLKAIEVKNNIISKIEQYIKEFKNNLISTDERERKKQFALSLNNFEELPKSYLPIAFCIFDDRLDKLDNLCKKLILTEGK